MTKEIILRRLDDMHCHFRTGSLLSEVLPYTAYYAGRAIAMPNTRPRAILTGEDVVWYREEIERVLDSQIWIRPSFYPLMTIDVRDNTTPEMIVAAMRAGVVAGKVYPLGVTTNSEDGLRDFSSKGISETFRAMEDVGMLLLIHGELDKERTLVTKRERVFLPTLLGIAEKFPELQIVLEHVSTKVAVQTVRVLENVAATITAHHLMLTLNDVIGSGIQPHNGCMPMPKDFDDRDALIEAATSGNPKFFLGSDTAPHPKEKKECARGACGVYTAPILPELLAEIFEDAGKLDRLEDFTSRFGAEFYGLPLNEGYITLVKNEWVVPLQYGSVVPFRAGKEMKWKRL